MSARIQMVKWKGTPTKYRRVNLYSHMITGRTARFTKMEKTIMKGLSFILSSNNDSEAHFSWK